MIDHLFMVVEADGPEFGYLAALGLVETYRRVHRGQGTRNVCYCFDNLFLELLWVDDWDAVRGEAVSRTGLYERSRWRSSGTCPFGIAWRRAGSGAGVGADALAGIPTWDFRPPYLPGGMSIPVAVDSDDLRQPMMFESPGLTSPAEWPVERRGELQHGAGLGAVTDIRLAMPAGVVPSDALRTIVRSGGPQVWMDGPGDYRLELRVDSLVGEAELLISLPVQE